MTQQKLQPVRGTHDLFGEQMRRHRFIIDTALKVAELYGFAEVSPPIFEFTDVFHRTLGETSDVVSKETYTFTDRGGESLTLRPEFTASVVRAFISNGLTQQLPFKAFYAGPAFRYERPQKGRLRQFHQIGVEMLGADAPWHDVEVLDCSARILAALGITNATLEINSLGDKESREAYRTALVAYFGQHINELSEESRLRLEKNPLRILDSKQAEDKAVVADAPKLYDYFTDAAAGWFAAVKKGLDTLGISYNVSPRLVRGLDYYTHTVFEWTTEALGAQNTLLAGGRYDGLVAQMGGPEIPGIGWAAGVERLALMELPPAAEKPGARVAVIPFGESTRTEAMRLAQEIRIKGAAVEMIVHNNVGKALKKADTMGAGFAVILGEDEIRDGLVALKDLKSGAQELLPRNVAVEKILAEQTNNQA